MAITRRTLILVGCGAAIGCGGSEPVTVPAVIPAGPATAVAQGTLRVVAGYPVAIGRDADGIYAISLVCTHQGCNIGTDGSVTFTEIDCNCHGSIYDGQGNVRQGPATRPLPHLAVTQDASGQLTIHGDQPVPASTRL